MFSRSKASGGSFRISIEKVGNDKCIDTVGGDSEDSKLFERDLLPEINQSLSQLNK